MPERFRPWLDIVLSVSIFIAVSVACGRIYRFPFDDEIYTLRFVGNPHISNLPSYFLFTNDPTPPLTYLVYYGAVLGGFDQSALRWICIGYVAIALAIWHWLTLTMIEASKPVRLLIAILFGLVPLALSQGDALRWYPMLTLAVAVAFFCYLRFPRRWYLSGIAFGLIGDVSFLAVLPLASVLFHRYAIERKFSWKEDLAFLSLGSLVAVPGFIAFGHIFSHQDLTKHFTNGLLRRMTETTLGFFGGVTLGVSQAWLVALVIAATIFLAYGAMVATRENQSARSFCSLVIITAASAAIFTMIGFSEPRGYLFLAPMVTAITSIGIASAMQTSPRVTAVAYAALLVTAISVAGNLRSSNTPFKRNAVIPYGEVIDFARSNQHGKTAVVTMDACTAYLLSSHPEFCVAEYEVYRNGWLDSSCPAGDGIDTVIVVKGDPLDENNPHWRDRVAEFIRGKQAIAQAHFGHDDDAHLKSRLSGRHLSPSLLDAVIYH
jgi:hypothetical protein